MTAINMSDQAVPRKAARDPVVDAVDIIVECQGVIFAAQALGAFKNEPELARKAQSALRLTSTRALPGLLTLCVDSNHDSSASCHLPIGGDRSVFMEAATFESLGEFYAGWIKALQQLGAEALGVEIEVIRGITHHGKLSPENLALIRRLRDIGGIKIRPSPYDDIARAWFDDNFTEFSRANISLAMEKIDFIAKEQRESVDDVDNIRGVVHGWFRAAFPDPYRD